MRGCQKSLRITLSPVTVHSSHSALKSQCTQVTVHPSHSAPKSKSQCTQFTLHNARSANNHSAQRIQVSVTIHAQLSHSAECIVIFIVQSCHSHTPVCLAGTETSCNVQVYTVQVLTDAVYRKNRVDFWQVVSTCSVCTLVQCPVHCPVQCVSQCIIALHSVCCSVSANYGERQCRQTPSRLRRPHSRQNLEAENPENVSNYPFWKCVSRLNKEKQLCIFFSG